MRARRGDHVQPLTVDTNDDVVMGELTLAIPHTEVTKREARSDDGTATRGHLSRLRVRHPYIMFVPQWDLLEMFAASAAEFPFFFSSRRRHTRCLSDWSSDVCSSD